MKMFITIYFILCLFYLKENYVTGILQENEAKTDGYMRNLRNMCPFNKFCGFNPLKKIDRPYMEPCCDKCSCDTDCFETGSCCPDMPSSTPVELKYPCKHLWDFGKLGENMHRTKGDDNWYNVINECPDEIDANPYQKCYTPKDIQDYVIVVDNKKGKLYRNKYCAECNGIKNYDQLNLRIVCPSKNYVSYFDQLKTEERHSYIMENCSIASLPPTWRTGQSRCWPKTEVISACNMTGKWDFYDNDIEKGCMTQGQNMVFRVSDRFGLEKHYANVYCFLCNTPAATNKTDLCKTINTVDNMKTTLVSFYAILDLNAWEDDEAMEKDNTKCDPMQIWDPFLKLCRQIFCPAGQMPNYGSCKGLFSNINGYTLVVNFEVNIKNGTFSPDKNVLNILQHRLNKKLGNDISCGVCRKSLFIKYTSTPKFYFCYEMFATHGCPYHTLLDRIRKIATRKEILLQFRHKGQINRISLVLIFEDIRNMPGFKLFAQTVSSFCQTPRVIDASILLYCPMISLSMKQINTLGLNNVNKDPSSVILQVNGSEPIYHQVCIDSYFSARQAKSASIAVNGFKMYYMYVFPVLIFSICLRNTF